mmetsp:Transcript_29268/g.82574  ORF Transcript_29268/g.82574 Transcript_29268/m.82574 type:complete len:350 (-) Transcript_29268:413-1462(-)
MAFNGSAGAQSGSGRLLCMLVVLSAQLQLVQAEQQACDIYDGEWVKSKSRPLYKDGHSCVQFRFNCKTRGTAAGSFQWKPRGCELPQFTAHTLLECLRNRRLAFLGDSLAGNWVNAIKCILSSEKSKSLLNSAELFYPLYNFSISSRRSNFLVTKSLLGSKKGKLKKEAYVLNLRTVDPGWTAMLPQMTDIVFVTGPHWAKESRFYQDGGRLDPKVKPEQAIAVAAETVAKAAAGFQGRKFWLSHPPTHFKGGMWHKGGKCDSFTGPELMRAKESARHNHLLASSLAGSGIHILNITHLSSMRPDAHPANLQTYNGPGGVKLQDCVHWCLPGVPDTWTELLAYELGCRS